MQKYIQSLASQTTGIPLPNIAVTIQSYPSGTPVTVYATNDFTQPITQPLVTGGNGQFQFYAIDGHYQAIATPPGLPPIITDFIIQDLLDETTFVATALLAAPSGSSLVGYQPAGTGAVATTVQAKLQRIITTSDFTTVAQAEAAGSSNPLTLYGNIAIDRISGLNGLTVTGALSGTNLFSHAYEDTTNFSSSGSSGYASYDSLTVINDANSYNHMRGFEARSNFAGSGGLNLWEGYSSQLTYSGSGNIGDVRNFAAYDVIGAHTGTITGVLSGLYVNDLTQGAFNYGVYSNVSAGANKWNINAVGSASNFFGGPTTFAGQIISSVATGIAPLVVTSTTPVSGLNLTNSSIASTNINNTGVLNSQDLNAVGATAAYFPTGGVNISSAASSNGVVYYRAYSNSAGTGGISHNFNIGATTYATINISGITTPNQLISTIATGTAPISVSSTTQIANLNAAMAGILTNTAGNLTSVTNIANQQTPTTGGVTLASQTAAAGSTWRVRASGTYVAANSVTARNAEVTPYWGATALSKIAVAVLASVAQTTQWQCEFILSGSSTTAIWTVGYLMNKLNSPAIVGGTSSFMEQDHATAASTAVTAGAQTLDLRFDTSVSVPGDAWNIESCTIERLT